jgi:hypothetical protein
VRFEKFSPSSKKKARKAKEHKLTNNNVTKTAVAPSYSIFQIVALYRRVAVHFPQKSLASFMMNALYLFLCSSCTY